MARNIDHSGSDYISVAGHRGIDSLDRITMAAWLYMRDLGNDPGGRIFDKADSALDFLWFQNFNNDWVSWQAYRWDTVVGDWYYWSPWNANMDEWHHHLITYDYSSVSNDPAVYVDGDAVAVTEVAEPQGAPDSPTGALLIGDRTAGDRAGNFTIAEVAIWDRVLPPSEARLVCYGGPLAVPVGLVLYMPLLGYSPEPNLIARNINGLITGTVDVVSHAPMPRTGYTLPRRRMAISGLALEQEGYRWRDDDNNEALATWLAVQDTDITRARNTNTRLRVIVDATGDPDAEQYQLEWRKVGDANWTVLST